MAAKLDFSIGPRLAKYIALNGSGIASSELEAVQRNHYGRKRHDGKTLKRWISHITECHLQNAQQSVSLPVPRQLVFWPEDEEMRHARCALASR